MGHNSAAKNAFGTLGVICWTVQLLPQIWKTYRTKSSKGLSPVLVLFWGLSGIPLGIYNIIQNTNIPLILQPQLFGFLCLFSWIQCQYYGNGRSVVWCACVYIAMLVVFAALEVGIVYAVRPHYERGETSGEIGVRFLSVLASVMIAVALLPQYYEIYKHKAVIGISMTFIIVDLLGGVFSDISLAFEEEFDPWLAVSYSIVSVMDSVIIVAALILNPRARRLEQRRAQHDAESRVVDQDTLDSRATPTVSQVGDTSATVTSTGEDERRDPEKADE